jgi:hypothetical protein
MQLMKGKNKILLKNDAEISGLALGTILRLQQGESPLGSAEWATEKAILERYDSVEDFQEHLGELSPDQQQGLISLFKGRAAEHLVAYETGGEVHESWNIQAHDIITPEGDHIQVKTGALEYIDNATDSVPDGIEIHTGAEGAGIDGVHYHEWSDTDIVNAVEGADAQEIDFLHIVGSSLAVGTILTGVATYQAVKRGEIQLNEAPRYFCLKIMGRTIRCAIVGAAISTGKPIIVSGAAAYIMYRNRHLLANLCNGLFRTVTHPVSVNIVTNTGHVVALSLYHTAKGAGKVITHPVTWSITKKTYKGTYWIATHNATKTVVKETIKGTGKVLFWTLKGIWKVATHRRGNCD